MSYISDIDLVVMGEMKKGRVQCEGAYFPIQICLPSNNYCGN